MLNNYFVYSDPRRETVSITVDDLPLIEKFLRDIMDAIKSCAYAHKVEECRGYCNLYLDIENEFNLIKDVRAERVEKERAEVTAKEDNPEVNENDPCGRIEF